MLMVFPILCDSRISLHLRLPENRGNARPVVSRMFAGFFTSLNGRFAGHRLLLNFDYRQRALLRRGGEAKLTLGLRPSQQGKWEGAAINSLLPN